MQKMLSGAPQLAYETPAVSTSFRKPIAFMQVVCKYQDKINIQITARNVRLNLFMFVSGNRKLVCILTS